MATYQLNVNGQRKEVTVDPSTPLLWVLREELKMTGTKYGCGISACGACTVHVAGVATRSCVVPVSHDRRSADNHYRRHRTGSRRPRRAGCLGGKRCRAVWLLPERTNHERRRATESTPKPTDTNIEESMGGNLCRCATYVRIREAIKSAAQQLK